MRAGVIKLYREAFDHVYICTTLCRGKQGNSKGMCVCACVCTNGAKDKTTRDTKLQL